MLFHKHKINKLGVVAITIILLLTAFSGTASAESEPSGKENVITTHEAFKAAVAEANDGDVLFVGDIDFSHVSPNVPKNSMEIEINKSITVKSGKKDGAALFTNGMLVLKGSKSGDAANIKLENIIFDGTEDINVLKWDDRLYPWDSVNEEWQYYQPTMASHAISFSGNVNASFDGCEFKNYVHEYGAVMEIYYGDYTDNEALLAVYSDQSSCKLELSFNKCSIHDNAAFYTGGAFYIEANNNVTLNMNDCNLTGNVCGAVREMSGMFMPSMDGGGAIYASDAEVNMTGCDVGKNECNRVFEGRGLANNYVPTRGGGLHLTRCALNMTDCKVFENIGSMGGGLALTDCKAELDGCFFNQNRAEGRGTSMERKDKGPWSNMAQGGALYVEGQGNKTVSLINCSVTDNFAEVAYGGICQAWYIDPSLGVCYIKMSLCTYVGNTCDSTYSYEGVDPMWIGFSVPVDLWASQYTTVKGCIVVDDDFSVLFPHNEKPSTDNNYNYYASPTRAEADGVQINKSQEPSVKLPDSEAWSIPRDVFAELVGERYEGKLISGVVGSNYNSELYLETTEPETEPSTVEDASQTPADLVKESESDVWLYICIGGAVFLLTCSAVGIMLARSRKKAQTYEEPAVPSPKAVSSSASEQGKPQKQIIIAKYSEEQIERLMTIIPEANLLTPREREVFHQILLGKVQSEIATHLVISASTVKDFYQKIYTKMGVSGKDALLEKVFEESKKL